MEREMEAPGFWDDPERSNQKMKELKNLKDTVGECDKLSTQYDDILTLIDMGYEENDESLIPEIRGELDEFIKEFDEHPFYEQIKICESFKFDLQALKDYDKNCKTGNIIIKQNIANLDTFINLLSSRIEVEPSNDEIEMYNL